MALVKFAPEIQGIRGHAAGVIFSANKSGAYIKKFAPPIDPNAAAQQSQRTVLSGVSALWRTLDAGQRTDWDDFAAAPPENDYDPWAEIRLLTGHQWFTRINNRLSSAGAALVSDPPAVVPQTPVPILTLVALTPGHDNVDSYLSFLNGSFSDGSLPVITLALIYSLGRAAPTNRYYLVYCGPTTASFAVLLGDILAATFGDYPEDTLLYATLCRQSTTGIRSTKTTLSCTVTT
jgi:hypothetical protein